MRKQRLSESGRYIPRLRSRMVGMGVAWEPGAKKSNVSSKKSARGLFFLSQPEQVVAEAPFSGRSSRHHRAHARRDDDCQPVRVPWTNDHPHEQRAAGHRLRTSVDRRADDIQARLHHACRWHGARRASAAHARRHREAPCEGRGACLFASVTRQRVWPARTRSPPVPSCSCVQVDRAKLKAHVAAMDAACPRRSRQNSSSSVAATVGSSRKLSPSTAARRPASKRASTSKAAPQHAKTAAACMPPPPAPRPNAWAQSTQSASATQQAPSAGASSSAMDADFPAIADALLRVSLQSASRTATPSKAATAAAATAALAYSSPLTDPQPPTKSTGAAASAAAFGEPIQPPPPPPLSKRLTRSQGPARVDAAAAAELRAQLDRERAERARAQALMRTALVTRLHGAGADIYETLKMEWVLQAECTGSERQMGMAFTARLKAARLNFDDLPESRGWGVYELGALQRVLTGDASLQAEVVAPSIAKWKDAQTQVWPRRRRAPPPASATAALAPIPQTLLTASPSQCGTHRPGGRPPPPHHAPRRPCPCRDIFRQHVHMASWCCGDGPDQHAPAPPHPRPHTHTSTLHPHTTTTRASRVS